MYPNLKLQIWKSGIRQNRLAKMLGMDETMLSRIVNGYRNPNAELRERIAALLHCDEGWLFEPVEPVGDTGSNPMWNAREPIEPK
jgi:transcriptional regulator with XRE-family HTH domain